MRYHAGLDVSMAVTWGVKLAGRQGNKRATVALARKIAVVMHHMWADGTTFRFSAAGNAAASTPA